ncbi:MAG: hypothetical protein CVU44_22210 [Chloroflexi bacterium HGW-Chloroflexi-6]|nr:MAG: hypothetical protein CVU44_22210 [Chloroflexi bacterium HGW-Chloroflexi-6]
MGIGLTISPAVREQSWQVSYRFDHWTGILIWTALSYITHRHIERHLPDADPYLLPVAAILSGWGMISIWRLTSTFGLRQAIWIAVGFGALLAGLRHNKIPEFLRKYKYIWLTSGLALTALTFALGSNPIGSGPRLWLGCCGIYLQPSEPLKLLLVVYLSSYFASRMPISGRFFSLLVPTLLLTGVALLILLIQRDLGTASIFIILYTIMVYLASTKRRVLILSTVLLSGLGLAGYFFVDIIQYRLTSWFNPWQDPAGRSYQVIQSLLAVANGGIFGRGIGLGSPTLVPVAHSDFIFSAIAEETGLIGSLMLLALIGIFVTRCFITALRADGYFQRLLTAGLGTYVGVQSIVIIGGNLRLLPLTGVTLPFVSYGGSSLLTSFLALMLLLQISNNTEGDPAPLAKAAPYLMIPTILGAGLLALALANGWWGIIRSTDLLSRYDNPRRSIADLYVPRGSLFDRRNQPIAYTEGVSGSYKRVYTYPELSSIIGYTHNVYGQSGLEAELDPYLRGLTGYPASQIWLQHLLYGSPPPGLDVRLSLDISLQQQADKLLANTKGSVVLLNAKTGEVLVMASHPTFDANRLDEIGEELLSAVGAPLLNRATQGQYSAGTSLSPFLLAELFDTGQELPTFPRKLFFEHNEQLFRCTLRADVAPAWENALPAGCPQPLLTLAEILSKEEIIKLTQKLGMQVNNQDLERMALGQSINLTPLTMALAASAISNEGVIPSAQLTLAVDIPNQGWVILPPQEQPQIAFSASGANKAAQFLQVAEKPYWESMGRLEQIENQLAWYLGGTLPGWQGTPFAIVVLAETDDPSIAQEVGQGVLEAAIQP